MISDACEACGAKVSACSDHLSEASGLPESWYVRCINGRDYVLCDVCGSHFQFKGGMSPYLRNALGLDGDARCEVHGEVKVMAEARAERRKRGKRKV